MKIDVGCDSCIHREVCGNRTRMKGIAGATENFYKSVVDKEFLGNLVIEVKCKHYSLSRTIPAPKPPKLR